MFIHVPASILSMFIYLVMAVYAALGLVLNTRLSSMMALRWRDWSAVRHHCAVDRRTVGQTNVGSVVGVDARLTSELICYSCIWASSRYTHP